MDYISLFMYCTINLALLDYRHAAQSHGNISDKLSEFGLIVPFSSDAQGRFISHVLSTQASPNDRKRVKRDAPGTGQQLFFNVTVFGRELHLRLRANRRLVAPRAFVEWQEDFQQRSTQRIHGLCVFTGDVTDVPKASVAISNCDGLAGLIRTDDEEFFIEPLEKGQQEVEVKGRVHVVYRRSAIKRERGQRRDDLQNEVTDVGIGELPAGVKTLKDQLSESQRSRRHAQKENYNIEVLLAVDDSVVRFHGKDHVQNYVLTLMNIVDEIYHDESLGTNINVVLVRMILVGYRQSVSLIERGNPARSLEQVCRWANSQQKLDPDHAEHHDHAIFLTRQDFGPAGYAPVTGMCHPLRSCTLNHEDGFSSAFVVAHETGHVLGMEHDGQGNRCSDETSMGSIMAPLVQAAFHRYHWSRCSKQELSRYIHSYDCLLDDPFELKWPKLTELPGINYSMDEQCRFDFGVGYKMCTAFRTFDPCKQLWCSHPDNQYFCKTKKGPPVDGTECAHGKWCFKGHCIWRSSYQPYGHDGGWSSWGKFGSCSRTCGGGIRSRSRQCNNPVPAYGGRDCPGSTFDYQVCNTEDCPGPYEDFRAQQCIQRSNKYYNNVKHTWLPYEHPDEAHKCELSCRSKETDEIVFMNQVMHDGTRCSYSDSYSVCARGECLHVGCDKEVASYKQEDKCGVCDGDNSHCRTVKHTLTKTPKKTGLLKMFDIPAGARHIMIEENDTSPHFIAVKNQQTESFILNAKGEETKSMTFIENGLEWEYLLTNNSESLKTIGPLHEGIVVLVVPQAEETKISLSYKYIIHEDLLKGIPNNNVLMAELDTYDWALKSWSPCSKSCGGGLQYTKYGCRRKGDGRLVHRNFCEINKKPKPIRKRCNTNNCSQPIWVVEEFGPCSKSCGKPGYQTRVVQCMQPLQNGTNKPVNTKNCIGERPETRRSCNTSVCPAQWRTGAWSQCSVSCGDGIRQRQVICKASDSSPGQCDSEKPESVSVCKLKPCTGEFPPPTAGKDLLDNFTTEGEKRPENTVDKISNEPCLGDKSIFCQMEVLARYCSIPGYQKLCCESCNRKSGFSTVSPDLHPPFSWLPDFTFPSVTSPDPTRQTSVTPTTAAPPTYTTKATVRRPPRPTATSFTSAVMSRKPEETTSLATSPNASYTLTSVSEFTTSPLPPESSTRPPHQNTSREQDGLQNQNSTLDSSPTTRSKSDDSSGAERDPKNRNSPVT
ncbi:A disintegrin and metalloproteinase with thrombospondin motifs 14 isoform X2 [Paramisgurnus dabryanus]|uniref:A disintegrin and metalloproteinase with thrombospondin motifs 14 isoform X2 n=1 Tax=Paramisgurnus dabryanus TaxID=90735 RepID=UPI003CCF2DF3